jgi:hypothetical protein
MKTKSNMKDNREIKILWEEKEFKSITNAGQFFDMICVRNYMAGSLGQKIPVDENRCGFKKLKLLLIK